MANPVRWSRWRLLLAALLAVPAALALWTCLRPWWHRSAPHGRLVAVEWRHLSGLVDADGIVVVPFVWEYIDGGAGDRFQVKRDGKWGFIDRNGKEVVPCGWDGTDRFDDHGMALVARGKKRGFIDKSGELVIPCDLEFDYETISRTPQFGPGGLLRTSRDGKWGAIDRAGKVAIPYEWDWLGEFDVDGGTFAKDANHRWLIDRTGKKLSLIALTEEALFGSSGLARQRSAQEPKLYGYIDRTGKFAIPPQWENAGWFDNGFAQVAKAGQWGFIDTSGKLVVPCEWEHVKTFGPDGRVHVERAGRQQVIDAAGRVVVPPVWESLTHVNGVTIVYRGGKAGVLGADGKLAVPCVYSRIDWFRPCGLAQAVRDGKTGVIDRRGRLVAPCDWDSCHIDHDGHVHANRNVHAWLELSLVGAALRKLGWDQWPMFQQWTTALYAPDGRLLWRSDFHALRFLLPWAAALFGLPALWLLWTARRKPTPPPVS